MNKPVNSEIAAAGGVGPVGAAAPVVPGDGGVPRAVRVAVFCQQFPEAERRQGACLRVSGVGSVLVSGPCPLGVALLAEHDPEIESVSLCLVSSLPRLTAAIVLLLEQVPKVEGRCWGGVSVLGGDCSLVGGSCPIRISPLPEPSTKEQRCPRSRLTVV